MKLSVENKPLQIVTLLATCYLTEGVHFLDLDVTLDEANFATGTM